MRVLNSAAENNSGESQSPPIPWHALPEITILHKLEASRDGLNEAQVISLIVLAITVPLVAYRARWIRREDAGPPPRRSRRARRSRV